jgi:hypothetical protein
MTIIKKENKCDIYYLLKNISFIAAYHIQQSFLFNILSNIFTNVTQKHDIINNTDHF